MRLNLGCGQDVMPGWVNLDVAAGPGVDVVHDLDTGPWPFEDGRASEIRAWDIFEHVDDPLLFMTECHRILAPGAALRIHTTYYRSATAYTDPTHKRFPTEFTFDYWIAGTHLYERHNPAYGGVAFAKVRLGMDGNELEVVLRKPS